tara:strand:+ start:802 stop:978 length:177 start_codon:yes stop_codon:yes gene_type:complete
MKVGDRVSKERVLKTQNATGTIKKITKEYVVVIWDNINGEWHYTEQQASNLEAINESR